jgi:plasmid stabilization system protein ParE
MQFELVVSLAVKQELAEAYGWYQSRNPRAAAAFRSEVFAAFDLIVQDPERWALWDDMVRRYVLKQFPYSAYFTIAASEVRILAVGHHRRQAGYWQKSK